MKKLHSAALVLLVLTTTSAISGEVNSNSVTTFNNGEPALASEVNGNIQALISAINNNSQRLDSVEQALGNLQPPSIAGRTYKIIEFHSYRRFDEGPDDTVDSDNIGYTSISNIQREVTFNPDGTLTGTVSEISASLDIPATDLGIQSLNYSQNDTYTQNGRVVTTNDADDPPVEFLMIQDGSMIVGNIIDQDNEGTAEELHLTLLIGIRTN